jgi:sec-independent protein translocase protein TatA
MLQGLTGWHFLIILAVILLLFGAAKLPALAKSMGQSARVFRGEMKAMKDEDAPATPATTAADSGAAAAAAVEAPVTDVRADAGGTADSKS